MVVQSEYPSALKDVAKSNLPPVAATTWSPITRNHINTRVIYMFLSTLVIATASP